MKLSRKPKVLMLGWEFPPLINGGLGVACHDLCEALSKHADISLIVPKSSSEFKMKNMDLLGLNHIDVTHLKKVSYKCNYDFVKEFDYITADLDPYYTEKSTAAGKTTGSVLTEGEPIIAEEAENLKIDNLYGGDVVKNVGIFARVAARLALSKDFDVIHAHDWMTMLAGMEIKAQTGKPLIVHVHSLEYDRSGEDSKGWVYQMEKAGMEAADLLMPVSNYTADVIIKHYHIDPSKIVTIHNGIKPVQAFKRPKPFKEKVVLFIGRLTRQKGPELFLDIASKVLAKDTDVRFVMAGVGEYFTPLLESSSYRHLGNRFHLTGFLNSDKLRQLLAISDVYCMPSVSEPFGLSAAEAAQFDVPCVISKQSGVAEVLHGSLKFDFWDTTKAADCIIRLLHDEVLNKKIVQDAKKDLQNITWDKAAEKVAFYYNKIGKKSVLSKELVN